MGNTADEKASHYHTGPAAVAVNRFCFLDAVGARTMGGSYHFIDPLVDWDAEPAWDSFTVIKRFEIVGEKYKNGKARVAVKYFVKCDLVNTETMQCDSVNKSRLTTFDLSLIDGVWKIESPASWADWNPHVFEGVITGYHGIGGRDKTTN